MLFIFAGITQPRADSFSLTTNPSLPSFGEMSLILFFAFQDAEKNLGVKDADNTSNKQITLSNIKSVKAEGFDTFSKSTRNYIY